MSRRVVSIALSLSFLLLASGCGQESAPVNSPIDQARGAVEPQPNPSTLRITPETSVGAVVAEAPAAARLFELVGIDYCCGGETTLAKAAEDRTLDVQRLIAVLGMLGDDAGHPRERRWTDAPLKDLVEHIVSTHHAYLRRELPRLQEIVATVLRVHGEEHPDLAEVSKLYAALHTEILPHLTLEEEQVFPAILSLTAENATRTKQLLTRLQSEHDEAGHSLHRIRALTNDFTPPSDACALYTHMLKGLEELERDLHVHVHLENNVLIPRAIEAAEGV